MNFSGAIVVLALGLAQESRAYNRTAAHDYIVDWCETDLNQNGNVDHVNNPFAFESPGVGNFVWWYKFKPLSLIPIEPFSEKGITLTDYGWDWIPKRWGFNCTNFVSQVLIGGGITFTGLDSQWDDAAHGTFKRVDRLYNALLYSANTVAVTIQSPRDNPSSLAVGDPVRFPTISHMAVIESTNPIVLAYNSSDFCAPRYMPLAGLNPGYFPLIGFHIIGDTIAARADVTPPTMQLLRADGTIIPDGGFTGTTSVTAILTDGGDGVERIEVFDGAPLIDGMYNYAYGFATGRFRDDGIAGGSSTSTISLYNLKDGATAYFQGFDNAGNVTIQGVTMDQVRPSLGLLDTNGAPMIPSPSGVSATSMTPVSVRGTDSNAGIGKITILKPDNTTSTQTFSGEIVAYATFSALAAGSYTAKVYDRAENYTSVEFRVLTSSAVMDPVHNASDATLPEVILGTNSARISGTTASNCPEAVNVSGPGLNRDFQFLGKSSQFTLGQLSELSAGTFTVTSTNCALVQSTRTFYVAAVNSSQNIINCMTWNGTERCNAGSIANNDPSFDRIKAGLLFVQVSQVGTEDTTNYCYQTQLRVGGVASTSCGGGNGKVTWEFQVKPAQSVTYTIENSSFTPTTHNIFFSWRLQPPSGSANSVYGNTDSIFISTDGFALAPGQVIAGTVSVAEVAQSFAKSNGPLTVDASFMPISVGTTTDALAQRMAAARNGLWAPLDPRDVFGSEIIFLQTTTATFSSIVSTGLPAIDTATLKVYGWTGSSWTLNGITQTGVSYSTSSGLLIASANIVRSQVLAPLFSVTDGSAPTTSWSIQGSSYGFAGVTFVSTYSYLVLSSTDPVVNGFHSGLATAYYRIDGLPGDPFTAYSSSLSFLPGSHWVDYYAVDFAGNLETIKRATITVTAGSVTKLFGDLQVDGNLLVGFLGSGAKAEVVARAEYDYALIVSSVDGRAMLAVDNANFVSIGTAPASGRLTLARVAGDTALALRSGNSTAAVTGAQLAFGYDGTSDLRHALYTQHGAAAYNNKMVFKLWTPATGSSSTLGNLPVLSLEGSSKTAYGALVHIMPAGLAENELVVSNGVGLGLGNVLRWERWQPSATEFKTGIERLGAKDEQAAWADVMALKPARYRRKVPGPDGRLRVDPAAPLERGYIFEEIPNSIRAGQGGISVDERLVNVELALKAAIREMNVLEERLGKLRAAKE